MSPLRVQNNFVNLKIFFTCSHKNNVVINILKIANVNIWTCALWTSITVILQKRNTLRTGHVTRVFYYNNINFDPKMISMTKCGKVSAVAMSSHDVFVMCHALTCPETVSVRGRLHLINNKVNMEFPINENNIVRLNLSSKRSACLGIVLLIGLPGVKQISGARLPFRN